MWIEDVVEVEPGIGVVSARDNSTSDPVFRAAQDHLRRDLSLFMMSKDDVDIVYRKEAGILLTSSLEHIETNHKVLDAYRAGIPVVLAHEVVQCSVGDLVPAYFSPARHHEYRQAREDFLASWELGGHRLGAGDRYFTTHTRAGGELECIKRIKLYLEPVIGPSLDIGNRLAASQEVDFVIVPTLRTVSANFQSALQRQPVIPVVRSYDLIDRLAGDEVPAWRWNGGEPWVYPRKCRDR